VLSQVCRYPAPAVAVIRFVFTFSVCVWGQQQCEGSINQHHAIILPQDTGHAPAINTRCPPLSLQLSLFLFVGPYTLYTTCHSFVTYSVHNVTRSTAPLFFLNLQLFFSY
jgi:hypothetical protein